MDNTSARPLVCLAAALAALAALAAPPPPAPGREAWTFRQDLTRGVAYHAREAYRLVDGYGLVGALETVAADLARYFASAARPSAKTLALARGKVNGPESYRVDVAANGDVTLTAEDDDGIRRAAYHFEARETAGDLAPATRTPWLRHRISRCFFGPIKRAPFYRDELMDDIDYYPAEYLNRLAHEGVNGLWLTVEYRDLVGTSFTRPRDGHERRLAKLRDTVAKCTRYGIRTWIFAIEPHAVETNDPFYAAHPDLFNGAAGWGGKVMCASDPRTAQYLEESLRNIFAAVPGLGGLLHISHGERATSCFSRVNPCADTPPACATCAARAPWQLHASLAEATVRGMRAVKPDAEMISWFYQPQVQPFRADWLYEAAKHMPPGVTMLYNFESGAMREQLGRYRNGGDYWLSFVGPAEPFRHVAASARAAGVPFGAKIQVGCSHEDATVPFVPVPGLLYRKYAAMKKAGCSAVMQCWYFGNYPGVMNLAAGELAFEAFEDGEDAFLLRLARPLWGDDAPAMAALWRRLSDAYAEYPLSNDMQYYGPFHAGVAWPLLADLELRPLGRTWKPEDPPSGDAIGECLENHTLDEALLLARRMAVLAERAGDPARFAARHAADRERMLDLGVVKTLQLQFRAAADIFAFYRDRSEAVALSRVRGDFPGARRALKRMKEAVRREIALTRELLPYTEADARLGFHSEAEQHQFFPAKLRWRIGELEGTTTRLDEIDQALAAGRPWPLSAHERALPVCRVGGGWIENRGCAFRARAEDDGDLVVEVRRQGFAETTLTTFDAAATLFPRTVCVNADGLVGEDDWKNVATPGHEATVEAKKTADGYQATIRLSALAWGRDERLRPALLRVQAGGAPVWPDVAAGAYRLNLGAARADRCGRLAWDARPAPPLRAR